MFVDQTTASTQLFPGEVTAHNPPGPPFRRQPAHSTYVGIVLRTRGYCAQPLPPLRGRLGWGSAAECIAPGRPRPAPLLSCVASIAAHRGLAVWIDKVVT